MKFSSFSIMSSFLNPPTFLLTFVRVLCVSTLFLVVAELSAQTPKAVKSVHITCVSWGKLSFDELYYREGQDYHALELIPNRRSKVYNIKGMSGLELYVKGLNEAGDVAYRLVGQSSWLPDSRRMLFFLVDSNAGTSLQIMRIDDSLQAFPAGAFRFFNMSGLSLNVGFGTSVKALPAKSTQIVKPEIEYQGSFIPFLIVDNEGNKLYESRLIGYSNARKMVFIMPPAEGSKRVSVKFISQTLPRRKQDEVTQ